MSVSVVTRDHIVGRVTVVCTEVIPQYRREFEEHSIAGIMPVFVVELLESVDVEEGNGQRLRQASGSGDFAVEFRESGSAVVNAGEMVGRGVAPFGRGRFAITRRGVTIAPGMCSILSAGRTIPSCTRAILGGVSAVLSRPSAAASRACAAVGWPLPLSTSPRS